MSEPLKLLAVFAHPDDESMGIGGTLAKYSAQGVETHYITSALHAGREAGSVPRSRIQVQARSPKSMQTRQHPSLPHKRRFISPLLNVPRNECRDTYQKDTL
jgi:LmbE family N-acetylglucosaminyl deacetylase